MSRVRPGSGRRASDDAAVAIARHYQLLRGRGRAPRRDPAGRAGRGRQRGRGLLQGLRRAHRRARRAARASRPRRGRPTGRCACASRSTPARRSSATKGNYFGPTIIRCARLRSIASRRPDIALRRHSRAGGRRGPRRGRAARSRFAPAEGPRARRAGMAAVSPRSRRRIPAPAFTRGCPEQPARAADDVRRSRRGARATSAPRWSAAGSSPSPAPAAAARRRLALQAAAEVAELKPDGVWWVELAPVGAARARRARDRDDGRTARGARPTARRHARGAVARRRRAPRSSTTANRSSTRRRALPSSCCAPCRTCGSWRQVANPSASAASSASACRRSTTRHAVQLFVERGRSTSDRASRPDADEHRDRAPDLSIGSTGSRSRSSSRRRARA